MLDVLVSYLIFEKVAFIASRIAERFEGLPRGVSVDEEDNDDDDDDDVHDDDDDDMTMLVMINDDADDELR